MGKIVCMCVLRAVVQDCIMKDYIFNNLVLVVLVCQWPVKRTWTAQQWPVTWMRSTASPATARSMGQKATATEEELEH